jgi:thiol:disulfide interchange protein DsbD
VRHRRRRLTPLAALAAAIPATGAAQPDPPDNPAEPRLIAEFDGLVPGRTNTIAVAFDIDRGWHTYWPGQNDTGMAPLVELDLPAGFTAGEILWPAPHRHVSPGGILDHVHEGDEATLLIPLDVPAGLEPGSEVPISADLEWLVCREACILGSDTLTRTFTILDPDRPPRPGEGADRIADARRRLPAPLPDDATDVSLEWKGGALVVTPERPVESISFSPDENSAPIADLIDAGRSEGEPLRLVPEGRALPVAGVLELTLDAGVRPRLYRIETRPPAE